jgi:hypothetical protein
VFALGTLLVFAGVNSAVFLFQNYAPAIFFGTLGLMALVPLLLGRETFTYYYARRQTPRWQQNLPTFHSINRLMAAFWTLIFFTAALLAASAPHDWRFTALYPNLLVFAVGCPRPSGSRRSSFASSLPRCRRRSSPSSWGCPMCSTPMRRAIPTRAFSFA